jgi:site-specific DNA-methyltransferase (adenine-specific)
LVRKPLEGTVIENVKKWGVGGLHIDDCRVAGRWPPNAVIVHHPECKMVGHREIDPYIINRWKDGAKPFGGGAGHEFESVEQPSAWAPVWVCHPDCHAVELNCQSTRSKITNFFPQFQYVLKASPKEKDLGCDKPNKWPTVKPIALMQWLIKLVSAEKQTILDPFAGTGTTPCACSLEDRHCVAIEQDEEAYQISGQRIKHYTKDCK